MGLAGPGQPQGGGAHSPQEMGLGFAWVWQRQGSRKEEARTHRRRWGLGFCGVWQGQGSRMEEARSPQGMKLGFCGVWQDQGSRMEEARTPHRAWG